MDLAGNDKLTTTLTAEGSIMHNNIRPIPAIVLLIFYMS